MSLPQVAGGTEDVAAMVVVVVVVVVVAVVESNVKFRVRCTARLRPAWVHRYCSGTFCRQVAVGVGGVKRPCGHK